jgi:hypothetical protein
MDQQSQILLVKSGVSYSFSKIVLVKMVFSTIKNILISIRSLTIILVKRYLLRNKGNSITTTEDIPSPSPLHIRHNI